MSLKCVDIFLGDASLGRHGCLGEMRNLNLGALGLPYALPILKRRKRIKKKGDWKKTPQS